MHSKQVNAKATLFPSKKSMLKNDVNFKKVEVISNHYVPNTEDNM